MTSLLTANTRDMAKKSSKCAVPGCVIISLFTSKTPF
jgi:hypothetical protein